MTHPEHPSYYPPADKQEWAPPSYLPLEPTVHAPHIASREYPPPSYLPNETVCPPHRTQDHYWHRPDRNHHLHNGHYSSYQYLPQYPPTNASLARAYTPSSFLHDYGYGPSPLFGWESVIPLQHQYGQPGYSRRVKPDYRRFCFSVGKADVPYAALPGGPLWGYPTTMSPQLVGR